MNKVFEVGYGAEALAVLAKEPVDLILCGINMPVMDGLEFVKRLATMESAKGIPVAMITTEGSENHVIQAFPRAPRGISGSPLLPIRRKNTFCRWWGRRHPIPGSQRHNDRLNSPVRFLSKR